jgi:hypothetical protein
MSNTNNLTELKEQVLAQLKQGICEITFNKVNGERRVMPCTLREDLLPAPPKEATSRTPKDKESDVISVWCVDKEAWRSFKLSNFISINISNEHKNEKLDSNT